jgi:signal transduction histidine kinase/type II secretory pathway pseudopilin PulG
MKRAGWELIAVIVTIAVVSILAAFQYRWTGEIGRSEQTRLKVSLATSVRNFDQEFSYDFQQLCESFEINPDAESSGLETRVAHKYMNWSQSSPRSEFVGNLYIWKIDSGNAPRLEEFNESEQRFRDIAWPTKFQSLRDFLAHQGQRISPVINDREAVYYPWTVYEEIPALIRPLFQIISPGRGSDPEVHAIGFLLVELNKKYLEQHYFPELVDRHFGATGQRSFAVSIRSAKPPFQTLYRSDPSVTISASSPDAAINLFDLVGEEARRRGHPSLQPSDRTRQWQIAVQHPAGSLERAVSSWRRRNLAISMGLLGVLAGSVVLMLSAARRSKALAKMQMEFVAGVSHELCTPLAVINSAAENLADGVVDTPEQMREYGGIIRGQGRRLERLVDGVLLFTAGRFGLSGYGMAPVDVAAIIEQSLLAAEVILREAGFNLEKEISAGLPPVLADPAAVMTCIENLLSNAIKYSNSSRWVAIRAREASAGSKKEVQIVVEDKGVGIPSADLPHILEPFYRVQSARENQIRGVGLGLHLVKRMMEDMGGRVSVSSELGQGTEVILHFPLAGTEVRETLEGA